MKKILVCMIALGGTAALFTTFFFAACGNTTENGADTGVDAGGYGAFGDPCQNGADCMSLVCAKFNGTSRCTIKCLYDKVCPSGSQGQVCNDDGYCVP